MCDSYDENDLVAKACKGNRKAFKRLCHHPENRRILLKTIRKWRSRYSDLIDEPEDTILMFVWARTFTSLKKGAEIQEGFKQYTCGVAKYWFLEKLKRRIKRKKTEINFTALSPENDEDLEFDPADTSDDPEQIVIKKDIREKIKGLLNEASSEDREIIILRIYKGLPYRKIAEILDITEVAARMRYMRAIERLAPYLKSILGI